MRLKSIKQIELKHKRVLLLVDYDVPFKGNSIIDDTRIRLSLPTIAYLRQRQAKIIILTKRGRPDGHVVDSLRLDPVARHLSSLLKFKVTKLNYTVGPQAAAAINSMQPGGIIMLENTRFLKGEESNDRATAQQLAALGDLVVNDQFSIAHRAEASRSAIADYLPIYAGLNLLLEVKMLTQLTTAPKRPFVAIIGGAKISDKLPAIKHLSTVADVVLVGGGVANNFLKASGVNVAKSYLEDVAVDKTKRQVDYVHLAKDLLGHTRDGRIQYPLDVIAAASPTAKTSCTLNFVNPAASDCPDSDSMFLDIGPTTIKLYQEIIFRAKTIFWNGPMGVFETSAFAAGTQAIAQAVADNKAAVTIIGGGDTIAAINQFKLAKAYDYVSAAGGAALEFLSGTPLPGIKPMMI